MDAFDSLRFPERPPRAVARDESQTLATSDAEASTDALYAPAPVDGFSEHARPESGSGVREGARRTKLAPGTTVAGRFEIVQVLRHGGMGTVCLVQHRFLGRQMALKVVPTQNAAAKTSAAKTSDERSDECAEVRSDVQAARERLANEGRIAARVRHPNVVTVHDAGLDAELGPYLAMELLEGQTLRDWSSEPRDPETCLDVLEGLLEGAAAVHRAGLVHRDLTPENVFLHREDGRVVVKLLDFGLASEARPAHVGAQLTRPGDALGKPHYRAPEQLRDPTGPCDARADVWSLGVIAHELLTRRLPVLEESAHDGRVITRRQTIDTRELGAGLAKLIASCIADDTKQRPSDARSVLRELRALRKKPTARPSWGVVATAALLGLVGLGAAAFAWTQSASGTPEMAAPTTSTTVREGAPSDSPSEREGSEATPTASTTSTEPTNAEPTNAEPTSREATRTTEATSTDTEARAETSRETTQDRDTPDAPTATTTTMSDGTSPTRRTDPTSSATERNPSGRTMPRRPLAPR